jgi:3D (Asp-Asp-Asp) domain-containing protein
MKKTTEIVLKILCTFILLINIHIVSYSYSDLNNIKYEKYNNFPYNYNLIVYEPQVKELEVKEETIKNIVPENKQVVTENKENASINKEYTVLDTFIGSMTGYGPDCKGCRGVTTAGHDLRNGNIYYEDAEFGTLRVLAADKSIPFGTVIRVSGLKVYDEPFLAIVLDRGGLIKDKLMDLAFESENDPLIDIIGYSKNITYEVLRYGW